MKAIITLITAMSLAGCLVESNRPGHETRVVRECPPAHHWEGGACVHNGKAKGHYK